MSRCQSNDKFLHVHHLTYKYGKDPWDYPLENFKTLCSECHKDEEDLVKAVGKNFHDTHRLALEQLDKMLLDHENCRVAAEMSERDDRLRKLNENNAIYDADGKYYLLEGRVCDKDGNPM